MMKRKYLRDWKWAIVSGTLSTKASVGIRLDADVLVWFKSRGACCQARINAAIRSHIQGQSQTRSGAHSRHKEEI
jgi:uncharacterized protein (DUF4415 family)